MIIFEYPEKFELLEEIKKIKEWTCMPTQFMEIYFAVKLLKNVN